MKVNIYYHKKDNINFQICGRWRLLLWDYNDHMPRHFYCDEHTRCRIFIGNDSRAHESCRNESSFSNRLERRAYFETSIFAEPQSIQWCNLNEACLVRVYRTIFPRQRETFPKKYTSASTFRFFFLRKSRKQWSLYNALCLAYETSPVLLSLFVYTYLYFSLFLHPPRRRTCVLKISRCGKYGRKESQIILARPRILTNFWRNVNYTFGTFFVVFIFIYKYIFYRKHMHAKKNQK